MTAQQADHPHPSTSIGGTSSDPARRLKQIAAQELALRLDRFNYDDAWRLGCDLVDIARARKLPIAVAILFGEQLVFSAAREGTSADNDAWLRRKCRVTNRYRRSSLGIATEFALRGLDFATIARLDPSEFAASGGAFPLRVSESFIGVAAVSGLTDDEDHDLVVEALAKFVAEPRDAR